MVNQPPYALLGQCGAIVEVLAEARRVSPTNCKVLLTGESGVGKGLLAQFTHENSPRRLRKMLSRTCAGIAQSRLETELFGSFEKAHRSTLLLADVGDMGPRLQARFLRFLEGGEVPPAGPDRGNETIDVRIISATNHDLLRRASGHAFSVDLYYRLNVAHLRIPPLRERREDIPFLMGTYLKIMSEQFRLPLCELDPAAVSTLEAYWWPGNLRQLREVAQRLAVTHAGRVVAVDHLTETVLAQRGPKPPIEVRRSVPSPDLSRPRAATGSMRTWNHPQRPSTDRFSSAN